MPPTLVLQSLTSIRRKARFLSLLLGIGRICACLVGLVLASVLLDYLLDLRAWPRIVLLAAAAGAAGFGVYHWLIRPLAARWSLSDVAGRVERAFPEFDDRLRSTLDFARDDLPGSEMMKEQTVAQATQLAASSDLHQVLLVRPVLWSLAGGVVALLLALGLASVGGVYARTGLSRLLHPFAGAAWPKTVEIGAVDGIPQRICAGERFEMRVALKKGYKPGRKVTAIYQHAAGPVLRQLMTEQPDHTFVTALDVRRDDMKVWVKSGDDESAPQVVNVVPRLAIARVTASITPPAYSGRPASSVELGQGPVMTTYGSTVSLRIDFNKQLAAGDGAIRLQSTRQDGAIPQVRWTRQSAGGADSMVGVFAANASTRFRISACDVHGFYNVAAEEYELAVRPDQLPSVMIESPRRNEDRTAIACFPLVVAAEDDFGISEMKLVVQRFDSALLAAGKPIEIDLRGWTDGEATPERRRFALTWEWDLAKMTQETGTQLQPGDVLEYHVAVRDNFYLDGQSHPPVTSGKLRIRIISQEELMQQMIDEMRRLGEVLRGVREGQDANLEETKRLEGETWNNRKGLDAGQKMVARRLEGQQGTLASRARQVAGEMAGIQQRLAQNRATDKVLAGTAAAANEQLNRTAQTAMSDAIKALARAGQAGDAKAGGEMAPANDANGADREGGDAKGGDGKGGDAKGADAKGADSKGGDGKGADNQGGDAKGADSKGGDAKGGDGKGGDAKGADAKGGDAKGGDGKGGDAKGGDSKGGDAKGADAKGGDSKGGDAKGGDVKGGEGKGGEGKGGEGKGGEGKGGDAKGGEGKGGEGKGGEGKGGEGKGGEGKGGEGKGGDGKGGAGENLASSAASQAAASQQLEAVLRQIGDFDILESLRREIELALREQERLTAEFEKLRDKLGQKPEDMTPEEQERQRNLAAEQDRAAEKTAGLTARLDAAAKKTEKSDPSAAQAMRDAAEKSRQQGVSGQQGEAARQMIENQRDRTRVAQGKAEMGLRSMLRSIDVHRRWRLERLITQLAELEEKVRGLIRRQAGHNADTLLLEVAGDLRTMQQIEKELRQLTAKAQRTTPLDPPNDVPLVIRSQEQTMRNTRAHAAEAQSLPEDGGKISATLSSAAGCMERALGFLTENDMLKAYEPPEVEALAALEEGLGQILTAQEKARKALDQNTRDSIREALEKIRAEERGIHGQTIGIESARDGAGNVARKEAVLSGRLAEQQGNLAKAMAEVETRLVAVKGRIFAWAARDVATSMWQVQDDLAKTVTGQPTQAEEARIIEELTAMIESLRIKPPDPGPFEKPPQPPLPPQPPGDPPPRMPTEAELRLLRALQMAINRSTTAIAAQEKPDKVKLNDLGARQARLRELIGGGGER